MIERIINNKHYGDSTLITRDKFLSEGEIVISNEVGLEGIYILNTRGEVVRIGKGGGSSESGSTEYVDAEFVRDYLRSHGYVTSAETGFNQFDNSVLIFRPHFVVRRETETAAEDIHTDILSFSFIYWSYTCS